MQKFSISRREKHTENDDARQYTGTKLNAGLSRVMMVTCVKSKWCEEKCC